MQQKFINFLVKRLFNFIPVEEILVQKSDGFYINGKKLEKKVMNEVRTQAKAILEFETYQLVRKELTYLANKKMFDDALVTEDLIFGKAMLYVLDIIHQKFTKLSDM